MPLLPGPVTVTAGGGSGGVGSLSLVYRYLVTGSPKASIDTGVDTPQAGSNDWTNGDVLELWLSGATSEAVSISVVQVIFNNDSGNVYDVQSLAGNNVTASAGNNVAVAFISTHLHGASGTANYAGSIRISIPGYTGTTFFKVGEVTYAVPDGTAGNNFVEARSIGYRSQSAITRAKVNPTTGNFAVGTQLLIYKRLAS